MFVLIIQINMTYTWLQMLLKKGIGYNKTIKQFLNITFASAKWDCKVRLFSLSLWSKIGSVTHSSVFKFMASTGIVFNYYSFEMNGELKKKNTHLMDAISDSVCNDDSSKELWKVKRETVRIITNSYNRNFEFKDHSLRARLQCRDNNIFLERVRPL